MLEQTNTLLGALSRPLSRLIEILPDLLAALVVLLIGWLVARLLRVMTLRSAGLINRGLQHAGARLGTRMGGVRETTVRLIAGVVYWVVILCFLAVVTNILGLSMFTVWLDRIVASLPSIISGVFIIFAGVILSNIARDSVEAALGTVSENLRTYLARAAQILTLTLLAIVGFNQLGVDMTVMTTVLGIFLACLFGGLSIAFSLGARTYVGNLIGVHYLDPEYRPGETIRIGEFEGTIVEITSVAVILDTRDGRLSVPARLFSEQPAFIVPRKEPGHE